MHINSEREIERSKSPVKKLAIITKSVETQTTQVEKNIEPQVVVVADSNLPKLADLAELDRLKDELNKAKETIDKLKEDNEK